MMKKGKFMGLLYREYYLGRHGYITGSLLFAIHALLGCLTLLCLRYGNLNLIVSIISDEGKEMSDTFHSFLIYIIKYMPVAMVGTLSMTGADIASKDTLNKWNRFEHCTPVTPVRYAAVKTISTLILTALSFMLAVVYLLIIEFALGENFTYGDFSVIIFLITVLTAIGILPQIFITLLKSRDMGWLCSTFIIMIPFFIITFINAKKGNETNEPVNFGLIDKAKEYCPVAFAVLGIAFAVLFVSMYLLYKRREK